MIRLRLFITCIFWAALFLQVGAAQQSGPAGKLVIVGGGGTPPSVMEQLVEMAGDQGSIVVIPYASSRPEAGEGLVEFFEEYGAKSVSVLNIEQVDQGLNQLDKANVIWMGGGSQNRLMNQLPDSVVEKIRERYQDGCVVGGTSAGAAVMSKLMITGEADLKAIRAGKTELVQGLGLTDLIVDQHFHRRQRFNRLLSAVLDHPNSIGVGIDERTAIIVADGKFEVTGESSVAVVDSTNAEVGEVESGDLQSATGIALHVLRAGDSYNLAKKDDSASGRRP